MPSLLLLLSFSSETKYWRRCLVRDPCKQRALIAKVYFRLLSRTWCEKISSTKCEYRKIFLMANHESNSDRFRNQNGEL
jgi:hypothetical protein